MVLVAPLGRQSLSTTAPQAGPDKVGRSGLPTKRGVVVLVARLGPQSLSMTGLGHRLRLWDGCFSRCVAWKGYAGCKTGRMQTEAPPDAKPVPPHATGAPHDAKLVPPRATEAPHDAKPVPRMQRGSAL